MRPFYRKTPTKDNWPCHVGAGKDETGSELPFVFRIILFISDVLSQKNGNFNVCTVKPIEKNLNS